MFRNAATRLRLARAMAAPAPPVERVPATEKQMSYLERLCLEVGHPFSNVSPKISKAEASLAIDALLTVRDGVGRDRDEDA